MACSPTTCEMVDYVTLVGAHDFSLPQAALLQPLSIMS
jgi:hypothetical protein